MQIYSSVLVQSVWCIAAGSLWLAGRTWFAGMVIPGRFSVLSGRQGFKIVYGYSSSQWQLLLCFCLLVRQSWEIPPHIIFAEVGRGLFVTDWYSTIRIIGADYLQQPAGQKNCQKHRCGPPCSIAYAASIEVLETVCLHKGWNCCCCFIHEITFIFPAENMRFIFYAHS